MSDKIEFIKKELVKKGYPLENYVQNVLSENGWDVQPNAYFIDKDTKKGRELDIKAVNESQETTTWTNFFPKVLIECKKIPGNAWIFFSTPEEKFVCTMQHSGLSNWLETRDNWLYIQINQNHEFETFATNYSEIILDPKKSNKLEKNIWRSVIALIKATSEEIENDFCDCQQYLLELGSYEEFILKPSEIAYVLYPIIVFDRDLFKAMYQNNEIVVENAEYVRLYVDYKSGRYKGRFCIDIMKKEKLGVYLEEIKKDIQALNDLRQKAAKEYEYLLFDAVKTKYNDIV